MSRSPRDHPNHLTRYTISDNGALSGATGRSVRVPDSCRFVRAQGQNWRVILDHDTGEGIKTLRELPMTPEVPGVVECKIRWAGPLMSVPCNP